MRSLRERIPARAGSLPRMLDDSIRYQLLSLLEDNPELSQRDLAGKLGMSLGKTNYCVRALIDKGWVRIRNFRNSRNKSAYLYKLTPAGVKEKVRVTRRFLALKLEEHAELTFQIEQLRHELQSHAQSPSERRPGDR